MDRKGQTFIISLLICCRANQLNLNSRAVSMAQLNVDNIRHVVKTSQIVNR